MRYANTILSRGNQGDYLRKFRVHIISVIILLHIRKKAGGDKKSIFFFKSDFKNVFMEYGPRVKCSNYRNLKTSVDIHWFMIKESLAANKIMRNCFSLSFNKTYVNRILYTCFHHTSILIILKVAEMPIFHTVRSLYYCYSVLNNIEFSTAIRQGHFHDESFFLLKYTFKIVSTKNIREHQITFFVIGDIWCLKKVFFFFLSGILNDL